MRGMDVTMQKFGRARRSFHWLIAGLLLIQIPLALYMVDQPEGADQFANYALHKSFGMVLFSVGVARLVWALLSKRPALPADTPRWEKVIAKVTQAILYILICLMPMSGWMMSSLADVPITIFGLFTLPMLVPPDKETMESFRDMHEIQSWILLTVITLHAAAALRHHFITRNDILRSMLPW
jgi:cytochrome b561